MKAATLLALTLAVVALPAGAVITKSETGRNLNPPTKKLANSGWQYQARWHGFCATPISPYYFVTAKHVGGGVGEFLHYQGQEYTAVECFPSPNSDLALWRVKEPMPTFAPLYFGQEEGDQEVVIYGRGATRGRPIRFSGEVRGWLWDKSDGKLSWGTNRVAAIVPTGQSDLLGFTFDEYEPDTECALASGDSGGGVFIQEDGIWRLAGVNYAVNARYSRTGSAGDVFMASLLDGRGFYQADTAGFTYLSPFMTSPQPGVCYATRISSERAFIESVLRGTPAQKGTHPLSKRRLVVLIGCFLLIAGTFYALRRRKRSRTRVNNSPQS